MEDGATPLIIAARLAVEGMVEDLVNADADINAADEYGKWHVICFEICSASDLQIRKFFALSSCIILEQS